LKLVAILAPHNGLYFWRAPADCAEWNPIRQTLFLQRTICLPMIDAQLHQVRLRILRTRFHLCSSPFNCVGNVQTGCSPWLPEPGGAGPDCATAFVVHNKEDAKE
jgi:hypothetical protein